MDFFDNTTTKAETVEPNQSNNTFDFVDNSNVVNNDNNNAQINANVFEPVQNVPQVDEAEIQRQNDRMKEENERRQKIEEKMSLELQKKNELKEKAVEFINDFEKKRQEEIEVRKKVNLQNEQDNLNNRKLMKEGKKNPWEIVSDNISMKESEYKGTKDVSRMRAVIVSRKNDNVNQNNII